MDEWLWWAACLPSYRDHGPPPARPTRRFVPRKRAVGFVNFLDPRLLNHELAEAHQEICQRRLIDGLASANSFQRFEDVGLLHHPQGERGIQRRQGQGAVFKDLDQLPPGSEQYDRAELRIE